MFWNYLFALGQPCVEICRGATNSILSSNVRFSEGDTHGCGISPLSNRKRILYDIVELNMNVYLLAKSPCQAFPGTELRNSRPQYTCSNFDKSRQQIHHTLSTMSTPEEANSYLDQVYRQHFAQNFAKLFVQLFCIRDENGDTLLHTAVRRSDSRWTELFAKYSTAKCLQITNQDNETPLELAFNEHKWDNVGILIQRALDICPGDLKIVLSKLLCKAMDQSCPPFLHVLITLQNQQLEFDCNPFTGKDSKTQWIQEIRVDEKKLNRKDTEDLQCPDCECSRPDTSPMSNSCLSIFYSAQASKPSDSGCTTQDDSSSTSMYSTHAASPTIVHSTHAASPTSVHSTLDDACPTSVHSTQDDASPTSVHSTQDDACPTSVHSTLDDACPTSVHSTLDDASPTSVHSTQDDACPTSVHSTLDDASPTSVHSTLDDACPTSVHSTQDDACPTSVHSTLDDACPTSVHSTQDDACPTSVHSTLDDACPTSVHSTLDDACPTSVHSTQDDACPTSEHSTQDDASPTSVHSTQDDACPTSVHSTLDDACPTSVHSTQDDACPTSVHSTQDDACPTSVHSTQDDACPTSVHSTLDDACPTSEHSTQDDACPTSVHSTLDDACPTSVHSTQDDASPTSEHSTLDDASPTSEHSTLDDASPTSEHSTLDDASPTSEHSTHDTSPTFVQDDTSPTFVHSTQDDASPTNTSSSECVIAPLHVSEASSMINSGSECSVSPVLGFDSPPMSHTDSKDPTDLSDFNEDTCSESGGTDSKYHGAVAAAKVECLPHILKGKRQRPHKRRIAKPAFNGPHHVPFPRNKSTEIKCRGWMNHSDQKQGCLSKDLKKRRRAIAQQRIELRRENSSDSDGYYPGNAPNVCCVQHRLLPVSTPGESASEQSVTAAESYNPTDNCYTLADLVTVVKCCRINASSFFQCLQQQKQLNNTEDCIHSPAKCYKINPSPSCQCQQQQQQKQQEDATESQNYCNCVASPVTVVECCKLNPSPSSQCLQQLKQQEDATESQNYCNCVASPVTVVECCKLNPSPSSQCLQQLKQQEDATERQSYCNCVVSPETVRKVNPSQSFLQCLQQPKQQQKPTECLSCLENTQNEDADPYLTLACNNSTGAAAINGAFFRLFGIPRALKHSNFCLLQELDVSNPLNQCRINALHIAVPMANKEALKFVLKKSDVSMLIKQCDNSGTSPLLQAMYSESSEILELLLDDLVRSDGCQELKRAFPAKQILEYSLLRCQTGFKPILSVIKVLSCCREPTDGSEASIEKAAIGELLAIYEDHKLQVLQLLPFYPCRCVQDGNEEELRGIDKDVSGWKGIDKGVKEHSVPVEAVDNDLRYSCMHYASCDGSLEVIKSHFRSKIPQCCLKHDIQTMVVCGLTAPALSRHGPIQTDRHSSLDSLTPPKNKDQSQPTAANKQPVVADSPLTTGEHRGQPQHKHYRHRPSASTPNQTPTTTGDAQRYAASRYPQQHELSSQQQSEECNEQIRLSAELLHAQYYARMLEVLSFGEVSEKSPEKCQLAIKFGCALAYYKLSKYKEAKTFFKECEEIASKAGQIGDVSLCSMYRGDIEASQQSFLSAAKEYSKAIDNHTTENIAREFRMVVPSISGLYAKLGSALRNASKVVDAVQAYRNAITTSEAKKDKLSAHTSLGNLFQSLGENSSALTEYEQSIKLSEELQDRVSLGWAHGNIGNAYLGLYQKDKALHHLEKSLDLTVKHEPTPQAIGRAYNNLGTAYQAMNDLEKAEEYYDLALGQAIYGNDIPGQARVYGNIGNVLMIKKDYERAIPHYTEVLRLSRDRSTVSTAFHNRGCAYYEWAETKKKALLERGQTPKARFHLYGPDFADCDDEYQPPILPNSILKYYKQASQDLDEVVKFHEESLESIKGSSKGLTLSVSLFESNSRTFHRLQDCLVNLGEFEKALLVAEQSRARSLGELLMKKKGWQINQSLTAPLSLSQIIAIVKCQDFPVVYFSYTGARLLGWVLVPNCENVAINMFEIPLEDDQFGGKSFDYHLRYSLTELLVEKSFEMYTSIDYESEANDPVRKLYELIAKPLQLALGRFHSSEPIQTVMLVPDSYTTLLPLTSLLDPESGSFLGDHYIFEIMPSLLTMGILDQLPPIQVCIPADSQNMCVVGNPSIPTFTYNGEQWSLGKLPHAAREAEWVAHILQTSPILEEQATKNAVLMRIMNSKVIHIATHGSAAAGFLAFAGMVSSRNGGAIDAKNVLIYPADVEHMNISPALVVLSSCDSGRGAVKADGIIGMARAFILAGAQAVLTTLWRVPDESASVFMQFFYQYLMDGLKSSLALQKAVLSLRCFSKYSQYIHWSGYQLTGRDIVFNVSSASEATQTLQTRLGSSSVFPRLDIVKKLESAFIKDPQTPTDVQILRGSPGMKPSEPLIDFIHSFHTHFKGGIFWVNGSNGDLIVASLAYIEKTTGKQFHDIHVTENQPVLVVFDNMENFPQFSNAESIIKMLKRPNTHMVVISKYYTPPDDFQKEIDHQLLRGSTVIDVKPLSMIHATQRLVHSILSNEHLAPNNQVQATFEKLAEFTSGSPAMIDVNSALLLSLMRTENENTSPQVLQEYEESLSLHDLAKPVSVDSHTLYERTAKVREISSNFVNMPLVTSSDPWLTNAPYDSWQAIIKVIGECNLRSEEQLLLYCLSMFDCSPIPMSVVLQISTMVAKASHQTHFSGMLYSRLLELQLLKQYPTPVILHPSLNVDEETQQEHEFLYVPQLLARAIWKDGMLQVDRIVALGTVYKAFTALHHEIKDPIERKFLQGLCLQMLEIFDAHYEIMNKECYKAAYRLYVSISLAGKGSNGTPNIVVPEYPHGGQDESK